MEVVELEHGILLLDLKLVVRFYSLAGFQGLSMQADAQDTWANIIPRT